MNKLVALSGKIYNSPLTTAGCGYTIVDKDYLLSDSIKQTRDNIIKAIDDWENKITAICDPIVSIKHCRVIPKTKRIQGLFHVPNGNLDSAIVGSYFDLSNKKRKHVMVYRLKMNTLKESIANLNKLISIVDEYFNYRIDKKQMEILFSPIKKLTEAEKKERKKKGAQIKNKGLSITLFGKLIQDVSSIENVFINTEQKDLTEPGFVSFYDTGLSPDQLLKAINLPKATDKIGSDTDGYAFYLNPVQYKSIVLQYPYLISMSLVDVSSIASKGIEDSIEEDFIHDFPSNEPIVGVIDTDFNEKAPFASWVEFHRLANEKSDTSHGTAVSSLIVDGPALNPNLEDGCGRFRVRHFSVVNAKGEASQLQIFKFINQIVRTNRDIKIWNLSLGTTQSIERNSISPVGALLDQLQAELDVVFIVAGTNNNEGDYSFPTIGSPADSINSIVVNSVDEDGRIPEYARKGPVLEFFPGPTLCAIGGSKKKPIVVYSGKGKKKDSGTSYAACWVTRKMAYLMHRLNLTREVAKALLVDSAYDWDNTTLNDKTYLTGAGTLPHHISEITTTHNDEFKVVVRDTCTKYKTYGYNIPIPQQNGRFPFLAKATLCYFPLCSRRHGVDYTLTELDLHFGRMNDKGGVITINNNRQGDIGTLELYEEKMKGEFGKWDSVKHISEGYKPKARGKTIKKREEENKPYSGWGFHILKKQRFNNTLLEENLQSSRIQFGLIITFKSIDKRNRLADFERFARAEGWTISEIDADIMNKVIEQGEAEVEFTE